MEQKKNLIVIGGGLCGLSASLTWLLNADTNKKSVLLLEKQPLTGGYVTSYKRNEFHFDTTQMIPNLQDFLDYFGISINLHEFTPDFMRLFLADPETSSIQTFPYKSGFNNFKENLCSLYPRSKESIIGFLDHSRHLYDQLYTLKLEPTAGDILKMLFANFDIITTAEKPFQQYISRFNFRDPEIVEMIQSFTELSSAPASAVSSLIPISVMHSLLDGAYRTTGEFIELPQKFENRIYELGGEIWKKSEVTKIVVENKKVCGVTLASGDTIYSDTVIISMDPRAAMEKLIGIELLNKANKSYARKVQSVIMSASTFSINCGLDNTIDLAEYNLDTGYSILSTGSGSFSRLFMGAMASENLISSDCFHLGITCPSLVTQGSPYITISSYPMTMGKWKEWRETDRAKYLKEKNKQADFLISLVEKYIIPDLANHIVYKDISTPATYARYSGSPTGSIYDMVPSVDNFARTRLKMRTPIKGLYMPKFIHGVIGAILSGMQAVDAILKGKVMNGYARYSKK